MKIEKMKEMRLKYLFSILLVFGLLFANFVVINTRSENLDPWKDLPQEDKPQTEEKDNTERVLKAIPMIILAMIIFFSILFAIIKKSWKTAGILFMICGLITITIALVEWAVYQTSTSEILLGIPIGNQHVEVHRGPGGLMGGCMLTGLGIVFWLHGR